jgi:hypothetical protein
MRTDTFTFDGGQLVKVEMLFPAPNVESDYRGVHSGEGLLCTGGLSVHGGDSTDGISSESSRIHWRFEVMVHLYENQQR